MVDESIVKRFKASSEQLDLISYLKDCNHVEFVNGLKNFSNWSYPERTNVYLWKPVLDRMNKLYTAYMEKERFHDEVVEALRVTILILENSENRHKFGGSEHIVQLMKVYHDGVAEYALRVIVALASPSRVFRPAQDTTWHGNCPAHEAKLKLHELLLTIATSCGGQVHGQSLMQLISDDFQMDCISTVLVVQHENGHRDTKHIDIPVVHAEEQKDTGLMMKELIEKYEIPEKDWFLILTKLRFAKGLGSVHGRRKIVETIFRALISMMYVFHDSEKTLSYFGRNKEIVRNAIDFIRPENRDKVPMELQLGALQLITVLINERVHGSMGQIGRTSGVFQLIGIARGNTYGVLPCLFRLVVTELGQVMSKNGPASNDSDIGFGLAFVEATTPEKNDIVNMGDCSSNVQQNLTWIHDVLYLVDAAVSSSSQNGASAILDSGLMPAMLNTITTDIISSAHNFIVAQCTHIVESAMINMSGAAALYKELDGNAKLIQRLNKEANSVIATPTFSTKNLMSTIFNVMSVACHTSGASSGTTLTHGLLTDTFMLIFKSVQKYGGGLAAQASTVLADIINNEPTNVNHVHATGLAEAFLNIISEDIPDDSELIMAIPSTLSALSLNTLGAENVGKHSPIERFLAIFVSSKFVEPNSSCFQGELAAIVGSSLDELFRHVPSFRDSGFKACVHTLKVIVDIAKNTERDPLPYIEQIAQLLEPMLSKSEHATAFADEGGVDLLLSLYPYTLPTTEVYFSQVTKSLKKDVSSDASIALCLAFKAFGAQHPTILLSRVIREVEVQLDHLATLRASIGIPSSSTSTREGAEGVIRSIPDADISQINDTMNPKLGHAANYLRSLSVVEWLATVITSMMRTASSQGSNRRWYSDFTTKKSLEVIDRLFALSRSILGEFAHVLEEEKDIADKLESQQFNSKHGETPLTQNSDAMELSEAVDSSEIVRSNKNKNATGDESKSSDAKNVRFRMAGCILLGRFNGVIRNLLTSIARSLHQVNSRRSNTSLPSFVRPMLEAISKVIRDHLSYPISDGYSEDVRCKYYELVFKSVNLILLDEWKWKQVRNCLLQAHLYCQGMVPTLFEAVKYVLDYSIKLATAGEAIPSSSFAAACTTVLRLATIGSLYSANVKSVLAMYDNIQDPETIAIGLHAACIDLLLPVWRNENLCQLPIMKGISVLVPTLMIISGKRIDKLNANGENRVNTDGNNDDESMVDAEVVDQLVAMGFSNGQARHALQQVGMNSIEVAMDWILQHPGEVGAEVQVESSSEGVDSKKEALIARYEELDGSLRRICLDVLQRKASTGTSVDSDSDVRALSIIISKFFILQTTDDEGSCRELLSDISNRISGSDSVQEVESGIFGVIHLLALLLKSNQRARVILKQEFSACLNRLLQILTHYKDGKYVDSALLSTGIATVLLVFDSLAQIPLPKKLSNGDEKSSNLFEMIFANGTIALLDEKQRINLLQLCTHFVSTSSSDDILHAAIQLLSRILRDFSMVSTFLEDGGMEKLLTSYNDKLSKLRPLVVVIFRRILEDPATLQQAMESEIQTTLRTLSKRYGPLKDMRVTPQIFVNAAMPIIYRDPTVFMEAVENSIKIENKSNRQYVVEASSVVDKKTAKKPSPACRLNKHQQAKTVITELLGKFFSLCSKFKSADQDEDASWILALLVKLTNAFPTCALALHRYLPNSVALIDALPPPTVKRSPIFVYFLLNYVVPTPKYIYNSSTWDGPKESKTITSCISSAQIASKLIIALCSHPGEGGKRIMKELAAKILAWPEQNFHSLYKNVNDANIVWTENWMKLWTLQSWVQLVHGLIFAGETRTSLQSGIIWDNFKVFHHSGLLSGLSKALLILDLTLPISGHVCATIVKVMAILSRPAYLDKIKKSEGQDVAGEKNESSDPGLTIHRTEHVVGDRQCPSRSLSDVLHTDRFEEDHFDQENNEYGEQEDNYDDLQNDFDGNEDDFNEDEDSGSEDDVDDDDVDDDEDDDDDEDQDEDDNDDENDDDEMEHYDDNVVVFHEDTDSNHQVDDQGLLNRFRTDNDMIEIVQHDEEDHHAMPENDETNFLRQRFFGNRHGNSERHGVQRNSWRDLMTDNLMQVSGGNRRNAEIRMIADAEAILDNILRDRVSTENSERSGFEILRGVRGRLFNPRSPRGGRSASDRFETRFSQEFRTDDAHGRTNATSGNASIPDHPGPHRLLSSRLETASSTHLDGTDAENITDRTTQLNLEPYTINFSSTNAGEADPYHDSGDTLNWDMNLLRRGVNRASQWRNRSATHSSWTDDGQEIDPALVSAGNGLESLLVSRIGVVETPEEPTESNSVASLSTTLGESSIRAGNETTDDTETLDSQRILVPPTTPEQPPTEPDNVVETANMTTGVEQVAEQNVQEAESAVASTVDPAEIPPPAPVVVSDATEAECPPGMDPDVFASLPEEMRVEVLASHRAETSNDPSAVSSSIDPETLAALPEDIRQEVLANERRERENATPADSTHAEDMDNASFVASLAPELRNEILTTAEEAFLATLPPNLQAEAQVLRDRAGSQYQFISIPSVQGGDRRSRRAERAAARQASEDEAKRLAEEHVGQIQVQPDRTDIANDSDMIAVVRMLYISDSVPISLLQRLMLNYCAAPKDRRLLLVRLFHVLSQELESKDQYHGIFERVAAISNSTSSVVEFPPQQLFGVGGRANKMSDNFLSSKSAVISLVARRSVSILLYLCQHNKKCILSILQIPDGESISLYISSLLGMMSTLNYSTNLSNLDLLVQLIEVLVKPLEKLKLKAGPESKPSKIASDWMDVPLPIIAKPCLKNITELLLSDVCTEQIVQRLVEIAKNLSVLDSAQACLISELVNASRNLSVISEEQLRLLNKSLLANSKLESGAPLPAYCSSPNSTNQELKLLRLLQMIESLSSSLEQFRTVCDQIDLGKVWESLSACLSSASALEGLTEISSKEGSILEGSKAGASSSMASLLARFLPMVEAFFVVNACAATKWNILESNASHIDLKRLVLFVEQNRVLLNTLVRENPSYLETSLAAFIKLPRCRMHLDFDNKRSYFQSRMRTLRQSAHRRHGNLRLQVRREQVFEDSFYSLRMRSSDEMRGRLNVTFQHEEGIDAGGLTREWYMILSREIFNPNYALFTAAANSITFQPNPLSFVNKEHLSYFKFVGRIIGKAISDGQLLDAHFTRSFYKHILGIQITYHDIEAIDPEYYRSLRSMLDNSLEDLCLDLTFSVEKSQFGKLEVHDLKPNGRDIPVTEENKMEYIQLVSHHKMTTGIQKQIDAFLEGFHDLISPDVIGIFNENELELLISGMPEIDIDDLKVNTDYSNYKMTDPMIHWFWNALYSFTHEERALFVQFVTGTSKVPLEGFKALEGMRGPQKFNIHKAYGKSNSLPSAHTCFNQLDLPEYDSEEQTREKLLFAIREGSEGFGFG